MNQISRSIQYSPVRWGFNLCVASMFGSDLTNTWHIFSRMLCEIDNFPRVQLPDLLDTLFWARASIINFFVEIPEILSPQEQVCRLISSIHVVTVFDGRKKEQVGLLGLGCLFFFCSFCGPMALLDFFWLAGCLREVLGSSSVSLRVVRLSMAVWCCCLVCFGFPFFPPTSGNATAAVCRWNNMCSFDFVMQSSTPQVVLFQRLSRTT